MKISRIVSVIAFAAIFAPQLSMGATQSDATLLSDLELTTLLKSKSKTELNSRSQGLQSLKDRRLDCEFQLSGQKIPTACFEVLDREQNFEFIGKTAATKQQKWLSQLCLKRAKSSHDQNDLRRSSASRYLPEDCRTSVIDRNADLTYMAETENPSRLFIDRFDMSDRISESRPKIEPPARKLHID